MDGEESGWRDVISGMPQGSVLGPMFFICFINDLPKDVKTNVFIFADDTKLFATVPENNAALQQDLSNLQNWSEKWQLRFNTTKCKVMHLGNQAEPSDYFMLANNELNALETVHMEKDLEVNVDDELNFEEHVQIQTTKANKLLAMIRSVSYIDEVSLSLLYKAIVRPHIEYCNTVWHPRWKKDLEALEAIQNWATKLVPGLGEKSYGERLQALLLPSLYYRRARGDMIECHKYILKWYIRCVNKVPPSWS